ncbi:alcohol dehydrogenase catalytic domain-containing protein [Kineococcus sp. R8]|uniref:zinc-dependent alcohol dehydrogenase n=1 Tax=Kineococcus siccus TaxID=2696567 RepID=UPI0014130C9D|nr:alcohol dehydrogenase catalytic domain-containing protein [Kineococcus siccus]NAZ84050.1 alcohol dehydrogenase catalytic domain-containing protein [Kineococcus siccus]
MSSQTARTGRAVRITAPGELEVVEVDVAAPAPGNVLVEVAWCGICGSDREVFGGTRPAEFVRYPVVPGHEWSGTVVEVGDGVPAELVGRGTVGQGIRTSSTAPASVAGDTAAWPQEYEETGFTLPGGWAQYLELPARYLHLLPEGADLRSAAGIEPAACVAEAVLLADLTVGSRVAVIGAGALGLLATQLLKGAGAEVTVVHHNTSREELARRCGAAHYVLSDEAEGAGLLGTFDAVVEAAGVPGIARLATRLGRPGGRVVLTGIPANDADDLSSLELVSRQVHVMTVFGAPTRAWAYAVRAFALGILDPSVIVTHEFPLEQAGAALEELGRRSGALKVLLRP